MDDKSRTTHELVGMLSVGKRVVLTPAAAKEIADRLRELVAENKAWRLVDSESRDAHPCPDLALRAEYRRRARELAKKNDATKEPTS